MLCYSINQLEMKRIWNHFIYFFLKLIFLGTVHFLLQFYFWLCLLRFLIQFQLIVFSSLNVIVWTWMSHVSIVCIRGNSTSMPLSFPWSFLCLVSARITTVLAINWNSLNNNYELVHYVDRKGILATISRLVPAL